LICRKFSFLSYPRFNVIAVCDVPHLHLCPLRNAGKHGAPVEKVQHCDGHDDGDASYGHHGRQVDA
jgi:hypothetical protein